MSADGNSTGEAGNDPAASGLAAPGPEAGRRRHLLINGLSIGSGGGYTVGRELFRHLAALRPGWDVTLALTEGYELHEAVRAEDRPPNARLLWAPAATRGRLARARYERTGLAGWAAAHGVGAVLQLNGMVIPGLAIPTFSHFQDPWPYRPEAWTGLKHRAVAWAKRRAHRRTLRRAAAVGFTSAYLRDLICRYHRVKPGDGDVYYNGLPDDWLRRAERATDVAAGREAGGPAATTADGGDGGLPAAWAGRPMELVSVSNVSPYKRHDLVIRAVAELVRRPGLEGLTYRIAGEVSPAWGQELRALVGRLGLGDRVVLEGRVPDERVRELLDRARAFVLMSVCESFGIPAIEAMSYGAPVVTADCCAMPEVCGGAAELCPPDDLPALVDRLAAVLTDPARAADLRRRGLERVGRFRWADTAAAMAKRLDDISRP